MAPKPHKLQVSLDKYEDFYFVTSSCYVETIQSDLFFQVTAHGLLFPVLMTSIKRSFFRSSRGDLARAGSVESVKCGNRKRLIIFNVNVAESRQTIKVVRSHVTVNNTFATSFLALGNTFVRTAGRLSCFPTLRAFRRRRAVVSAQLSVGLGQFAGSSSSISIATLSFGLGTIKQFFNVNTRETRIIRGYSSSIHDTVVVNDAVLDEITETAQDSCVVKTVECSNETVDQKASVTGYLKNGLQTSGSKGITRHGDAGCSAPL